MSLDLEMDLGRDLNLELVRPRTANSNNEGDQARPGTVKRVEIVVPPSPPTKEASRPGTSSSNIRPGTSGSTTRPGTSASTRPGTSASTRPGTSASTGSKLRTRLMGLPAGPKKPSKPLTIHVDTWKTSQAPPRIDELPRLTAPRKAPQPPRPVWLDGERPTTSSSKRLSWGSIASSRRPIKYGTGKHARVELVPQPSDDPDDPLNWPMWKKELNFGALLMMVALVGVMKTVFVSVNSVLALNYSVAYTLAVALTGAPLIVSAFTGLLSLSLARIWGKRPVYLVAWAFIFIGAMWNLNVASSYGQCMAARIFQGIGWGAFDMLVLGSIYDTYFEHERGTRLAIYHIVTVAATWGAPLLGGVASESARGFSLQFEIIDVFLIPATLLLALGAPETVFDRSYTAAQTPSTGQYQKSMVLRPRMRLTVETAKEYLATLKPHVYTGVLDLSILLQAPSAVVAPTTILLFLVSFLPLATLWGLTASASLLFSPLPFLLDPASVGVLLTGPWLLIMIPTAAFALLPAWHTNFTPRLNAYAVAGGSLLVFIGLVALGLHLDSAMTIPSGASTSIFALDFLGDGVSFPAVSLLLGLLAAGGGVLDAATVRPLIRRSTQFTSANLGVALRCTVDMDGGVAFWRALAAGIFVMAVPNAAWWWDLLKSLCLGVAVAQVLLAAALAALWWFYDEHIRRLDGRVLGCVDLELLKRAGSFFDMD